MKERAVIRLATLSDIPGIVALDNARYGEIQGQSSEDAYFMFRERLRNSGGYFWIATHGLEVVGLLSGQRTKYATELFESWEDCTNNVTLDGTGDLKSKIAYVAALTVSSKGSHLNATDQLIVEAISKAISDGVETVFFSGRMPNFHRFESKMSAEEYYNATRMRRGQKVALDPQIRFYEEMGMKRSRLVENGFLGDSESRGYAVLFTFDLPFSGWPFPRLWGWIFRTLGSNPSTMRWLNKLQ